MLFACGLAWLFWPSMEPVPEDLSVTGDDGTVYTVVTDGKLYAVSWEAPSGVTSVLSECYQTEKEARKFMHVDYSSIIAMNQR